MRKLLHARWLWITALFAAINIIGIVKIASGPGAALPRLSIESFEPPQGDALTGQAAGIRLAFNQPMAAVEQLGKPLEQQPVSFTPPIRGQCTWANQRTLAFQPDEPLKLATRYTATVAMGVTSLAGSSLDSDAVYSFQTAPLRVLGITQTGHAPGSGVRFAVEFNDRVDPRDLDAKLSLRDQRNQCLRHSVETSSRNRAIIVRCAHSNSSELRISIAKGLQGQSGPLGLASDASFSLAPNAGLTFGGVQAYAWGSRETDVQLTLSQPVDPQTAAASIRVEPQVEFTVQSIWSGLSLRGPFEPGKRYRLTLLAGMKATGGAMLKEDVVRTFVVGDIPPTLRFKTRGMYLSSEGSMLLPLVSTNVPEVQLTVEQVYKNNIIHFMRDFSSWRHSSDLARTVLSRSLTLERKQNETQTIDLDLRQLLGSPSGVYVVTARNGKNGWPQARQLVLVGDLGITAKRSETDLLVWVNTLSSAQPAARTAVSVYSRGNQKLGEAYTDEHGLARFAAASWKRERAPFAVLADNADGCAFINLGETSLDTTAFDVAGRPHLRKGYEAFIYADRGIYRPGETAHLHAMVRAPGPAVPASFPVELRVTRPDSREFKTFAAKLSAWGSLDVDLELPEYCLTGVYTATLRLPGQKASLGSASFQVEEFIPDRMKVAATAADVRLKLGDEAVFTVKASHLFGAPAAGRCVVARIEYVPATFQPRDWKSYTFCNAGTALATVSEKLGEALLDAKGEKAFKVKVPQGLKLASHAAVFTATVKEVGGRGVTVSVSRAVDPVPFYIGVARRDATAADRQTEEFDCVVVDGEGKIIEDAELHATLSRALWHTVLKLDNDRYRYESQRELQQVAEVPCTIINGRGIISLDTPSAGEYELRVSDKQNSTATALTFYCGGDGYVPWSMAKPDKLELTTDQPRYAPGDTARILLKAPFAGRALLTVESDRVHLAQAFDLEANTKEFSVPVDESWSPNVYCTITVIRPVDAEARWAVHRAYGTVPVFVDCRPRKLHVDASVPSEVRPGQELRVELVVRDSAGAPCRSEVTVAAIDEGICSLTNYRSPDPWEFFYGKRRLQITTSDVYSLLMPEVGAKKVGTDSVEGGGDEGGGEKGGGRGSSYDRRLFNPVSAKRVKPVALWQSKIETADDGRAVASFTVPEFTGRLRVVVTAANARDFGSCDCPVEVRQPLMVSSSFPRFLAPGDDFIVPVTVFNTSDDAGSVNVMIDGRPSLECLTAAEQKAEVDPHGERTVFFRMRAPATPGVAGAKITATLGQETAVESVELAVRPTATLQFETGSGSIAAGASAEMKIPGDWLPKSDKYQLSFSALPMLKLAASLRYLVRYPYGCVEQTTSSAFPLLYLADVAEIADPPTFNETDPRAFAQAGVDRLLAMQTFNGGFSTWLGYRDPYPWGSVYATHFLVEAEKAGYDVHKDALDAALGYLDNQCLSRNQYGDCGDGVRAYACFVLADAGRPNRSWTYRLFEDRAHLGQSACFHVAGALALMNDYDAAAKAIETAALPDMKGPRELGGDLHSPVREAAIMLAAYADVAPAHRNVAPLVGRLEAGMASGRWATTQENAFALVALGKYIRNLKKQAAAFQAEVTAGGETLAAFTQDDRISIKPNVGGQTVRVSVKGEGRLYYFWSAEGIPAAGEPAPRDNRLSVRRRFLSADGKPLDPQKLMQGEVVIVEISLKADSPAPNLVINDLLPAGLEIENPRLATSEMLPWDSTEKLRTDHVEMRDDRLIIFANVQGTQERVYRYIARAVTCGRFKLPAISAFCMYDPGIISVHGAGTVTVNDSL